MRAQDAIGLFSGTLMELIREIVVVDSWQILFRELGFLSSSVHL